MNGTLTEITGLLVGHYTDAAAKTGCTAILCEKGAVAGVDVRGSAPGTRETDLLRCEILLPKLLATRWGHGGLSPHSGAFDLHVVCGRWNTGSRFRR